MDYFCVTLIDVGWGDSILLEYGKGGNRSYALIDSNDTEKNRSAFIYLKKHFERYEYPYSGKRPLFSFVLLSHAHSDHGQGLKAIMREFGTESFWYPKSLQWAGLSTLIRFANRSSSVKHHQSIDNTKIVPPFGDVAIDILWPRHDEMDRNNENNNSVVMLCTFRNHRILLSGDAEGEVWDQIADLLPDDIRVVKVPHHGSENGTFWQGNRTPWLDRVNANTLLGISSHVRPFQHPDKKVVDAFHQRGFEYFRTDENYHVSFLMSDGGVEVKYSH